MRPLFVYVAAAVVTTWPLAWHPTTLLGAPVGPGDPYLNLWILGWGMQAILSNPASLLTGRVFDANIFHPAAGTLAYSDHLLLQSAVMAPLFAVTHDVVLCYNVLLLASLVASALAMHLFVRSVIGTTGGAYLAGLAWGFGSYRFAHLLHLQLQSLYFLPLAFLFLHRLVAGWRRHDAVALGILAALQAVSSVYYGVIGAIGLACAAVPLTYVAGRRGLAVIGRRFLLAAIVGAVLVAPMAAVYWRVQQTEGFGRNLYEASRNAAYGDSYAQVPAGNVLYGRTGWLRHPETVDAASPPHTGPERELFPGLVILALAVVGIWLGWRGDGRPLVLALGVLVAVGFVLSLGPDGIRPLYAALHRYMFGFQAIRAPARFAVLVMFGLCGLGALGWRELSARAHRAEVMSVSRVVAAVLLACAALEWMHVPVALAGAPTQHTDVGDWLRRQSGPGAVVVLPIGLDIESTPAMVQSLEHRRPLLNGYSGQRPAFYASLVDALVAFPSDDALLALHESGVRFVVAREAVAADAVRAPSPLVERARFADATIYELQWTPETEARLTRPAITVPAPPGRIPFHAGELARYAVAWGGAGMDVAAGEVTIRVDPGPGSRLSAYRFVIEADTAPWMSRFFEARDRFVTSATGELLPRVHEREQHEGSRHATRAFVFDHAAGVVRQGASVDQAQGERAVALPLAPYARDALTALFYARTLELRPGRRYELPINEAGRSLKLEFAVAARETITVQGRAVESVRLMPTIHQQVQRRQPVTATLWLSVDPRHVPLALEVEAGFGRVRAELIGYHAGVLY